MARQKPDIPIRMCFVATECVLEWFGFFFFEKVQIPQTELKKNVFSMRIYFASGGDAVFLQDYFTGIQFWFRF